MVWLTICNESLSHSLSSEFSQLFHNIKPYDNYDDGNDMCYSTSAADYAMILLYNSILAIICCMCCCCCWSHSLQARWCWELRVLSITADFVTLFLFVRLWSCCCLCLLFFCNNILAISGGVDTYA